MRKAWPRGVPWAGLVTGPLAWSVNQMLTYALVPWVCANEARVVPLISIALALVALSGSVLSWRALRSGRQSLPETHAGGHPADFLAGIGVLIAILFAAVIVLQGAAGMVFHGCER